MSLPILALTACSEDSPASIDPQDFIETRSAADSTAADEIKVDPTWGDTLDYNFDSEGNVIIALPADGVEEGDASEAV